MNNRFECPGDVFTAVLIACTLTLGGPAAVHAQGAGAPGDAGPTAQPAGPPAPASAAAARAVRDAPALASLLAEEQSDLRIVVERYARDHAVLGRRYDVEYSPARRARFRRFYESWVDRLAELDFDALNREGHVDYILLRNRLEFELAMLDAEARLAEEMAPLVPFARRIQTLKEDWRARERIDGRAAADTLAALADEVEERTAELRGGGPADVKPVAAYRAVRFLGSLRRDLEDWYSFYDEYDPDFTWWAEVPYERLDGALEEYAGAIRRHVVGIREGEEEPIVGDPIGEDGLRAHLKHAMIPYTAAELIAIAEREFEWCERELLRASREMGYGDDWKAAQEAVKQAAVPPGEKPWLVRDLAYYSEEFVEEMGEITIPPLAREVWRMSMMSPERQRVAPFFLGGEVIRISYPTSGMSHADKLMSMRGNNPHFNYGTIQHELIPGHHLQGFMTSRFHPHRSLFRTPFWGEGGALYWEMVLWDEGFPRGPEDRIGMLFWRMHRAARIIFSLSFHLERMTPQEAVDFLVDRVGHERANAEAEVRRSFGGGYSPLYQAAYMLGGLQFRALREELVESGRMEAREFHDRIYRGGRMPVEMVRARLTDQPLSPDYQASWRFAGDPLEGS